MESEGLTVVPRPSAGSVDTACRVCVIFRAPKKRTNRATHLIFEIGGSTVLACRMHAEMLLKGGAFGFALAGLPPLLFAALTAEELADRLQMASLARRPAPARPVLGSSGAIVIKAENGTLRIEGLPSG